MKRALSVVVALVFLIGGLGLVVGGALTIGIFGTAGSYTTDTGTVAGRPAAVALIADISGVDVPLPMGEELGESTIVVKSQTGEVLFLGRGQQAAVDEYLFGLPYDVLSRDGDTWRTAPVPGVTQRAPDPVSRGTWVDQDTGTTAELPLRTTSARTFAIMNEDGSPGVTASILVRYTSTYLFPAAAGSLLLGLLLSVLGVYGLLRWGRRREA